MKNLQVSEIVVTIPRLKFFEFYSKENHFSIFSDSIESAFDVVSKNFDGEFSLDHFSEVPSPNTKFLFILCDSYVGGVFTTSLCRVPLRCSSYFEDLINYFRFNIDDSIHVCFE